MIDLLVITDGRREHLPSTLAYFDAFARGNIGERWIWDDSGDEANHEWLRSTFPQLRLIWHPAGRQGFGGAIRGAWESLAAMSEASHIFHLEDDFMLMRDVNIDEMASVLDKQPHLAQIALRRQPWNDQERRAGGIVEQNPDAYVECRDEAGHVWLEHRLFFTTNPCLYRRELIEDHDWPIGHESEGRFSHQLMVDSSLRFAFWGSRHSGEWVLHRGRFRKGNGY